MISAIIYDMDGLIIDSEPLWRRAEIAAFAEYDIHLTYEMCSRTMGLRVDEVVQYWFSQYPGREIHAEALGAIILKNVTDLIMRDATPMEGVIDSVRFFQSQGYQLALASSSDLSLIEAVLDSFQMRKKFTVVHSAQFEPYGKPHPGVYITTANMLGVLPGSCLALEDSVNGMISAKAAKMKCFGVPDKSISQDKRLGIADRVIPSLLAIDEPFWANFLESVS